MTVTRDSLILRITQGGDDGSWREFNAAYRPYLHNVIRRWGMNEEDAGDIVQDVFVRLLRVLPGFEYQSQRGRFRGWLKTIAQHVATDRMRRQRRRREVVICEDAHTSPLPVDEPDWDRTDRLDVMQNAMQHVRATSVETTWKCFEEHFLKQRPAGEVSEDLGVSCPAVYMNTSRTLGRIRARCAEFHREGAHPSAGECERRTAACHVV